jgi:hypothetical protein
VSIVLFGYLVQVVQSLSDVFFEYQDKKASLFDYEVFFFVATTTTTAATTTTTVAGKYLVSSCSCADEQEADVAYFLWSVLRSGGDSRYLGYDSHGVIEQAQQHYSTGRTLFGVPPRSHC